MERQGEKNSRAYYQIDLSDCYSRDVTSYRRGIRLDRKTRRITVQDELTLRGPSVLWWQMHTQAEIDISKDGRTATLTMRDKTMTVRIAQPASGARFVELPATYIPGRDFPLTRNTPNTGFRKLALRHTASGDTGISVDFIPMQAGASASRVGFEPMSTW